MWRGFESHVLPQPHKQARCDPLAARTRASTTRCVGHRRPLVSCRLGCGELRGAAVPTGPGSAQGWRCGSRAERAAVDSETPSNVCGGQARRHRRSRSHPRVRRHGRHCKRARVVERQAASVRAALARAPTFSASSLAPADAFATGRNKAPMDGLARPSGFSTSADLVGWQFQNACADCRGRLQSRQARTLPSQVGCSGYCRNSGRERSDVWGATRHQGRNTRDSLVAKQCREPASCEPELHDAPRPEGGSKYAKPERTVPPPHPAPTPRLGIGPRALPIPISLAGCRLHGSGPHAPGVGRPEKLASLR